MKPIGVIESKRWVNYVTGRTASIYGACPWTSLTDKLNWIIQPVGWTLLMDNGTVGYGQPAFKTKEEAIHKLETWGKPIV